MRIEWTRNGDSHNLWVDGEWVAFVHKTKPFGSKIWDRGWKDTGLKFKKVSDAKAVVKALVLLEG